VAGDTIKSIFVNAFINTIRSTLDMDFIRSRSGRRFEYLLSRDLACDEL
jgi:hypothetical protein